METNKIDMFLAQHAERLPEEFIPIIKQKLADVPDEKADQLIYMDFKNPTTVLLISIFLGQLGIDRFMLGDTGLGVLKLLTCGGCGIWWLVDLFSVSKNVKKVNYNKFLKAIL